jgi:hypothetical protein
MTLDLIADQVRQGVADRTGQLADDDLGLGTQMILRASTSASPVRSKSFAHGVTSPRSS